MKDRNALIGPIVACTVTLLVAIGGMWVSMNARIDAVELRLREEIHTQVSSEVGSLRGDLWSLDTRLSTRIDRLADEVSELNERVSRIEGFLRRELEFLRGRDDE